MAELKFWYSSAKCGTFFIPNYIIVHCCIIEIEEKMFNSVHMVGFNFVRKLPHALILFCPFETYIRKENCMRKFKSCSVICSYDMKIIYDEFSYSEVIETNDSSLYPFNFSGRTTRCHCILQCIYLSIMNSNYLK